MNETLSKKDILIKVISYLFALTIVMFLFYLICGQAIKGSEKDYSNSYYSDYSMDWEIVHNGQRIDASIPCNINANAGEHITLSKTISESIPEGTWLMLWNKGQDLSVYVDDELRKEYNSSNRHSVGKDIPLLYIFVPLYTSDAGKTITIDCCATNSIDAGKLGNIYIGDKTTLLSNTFQLRQIEIGSAVFLFVLGIICFIGSLIIWINTKNAEPLTYLGLCICLATLWILLNSQLRQFFFSNVSITRDCAFLVVGLIPMAFSMYLNLIQGRKYYLSHILITAAGLVNIILQFILSALKIRGLSQMFLATVAIAFVTIVNCIITIIIDVRQKRIKSYSIVAVGFLLFALCAVIQIILYETITDSIVSGSFMVLGMFLMLMCSVTEAIKRLLKLYIEKEDALKAAETVTVSAMETLVKTVDAKDKYTSGHSSRVAKYSRMIGEQLGLSLEEQDNLYYVGLLHDVGKIGIPDTIINKESRLTDDEYAIIKTHSAIGAEILEHINIIPNITVGAHWHHEKYDGTGYPDGLKGEEIPFIARIIGVADAYDAMTSNRSYRSYMKQSVVREELVKNKGKQFDPVIADIMIALIDEDKEYKLRERSRSSFSNK